MDYKEKYEQALERAKYYHDRDNIQFLENIFPELKESEDSEDEKIRKYLIDVVNDYCKGSEHDGCIAWLEKQGKRDARYKYLEELLEADTIYQMAMNDAMVEEAKTKAIEAISNMDIFELLRLEKQGEMSKICPKYVKDSEQKPAKTPQWMIDFLDEHRKHFGNPMDHDERRDVDGKLLCIKEWLEGNYVEQKPAWSEEDEKTINNICHIIRQYDKISKKENQPCWYIGDCLLWMQNIKNKVIPQPKREWSEEDENRMKKVMHILSLDGRISNTELQSIYDWLKSFRPQSQ